MGELNAAKPVVEEMKRKLGDWLTRSVDLEQTSNGCGQRSITFTLVDVDYEEDGTPYANLKVEENSVEDLEGLVPMAKKHNKG